MESIQGDPWGTSSVSGLRSRSRTQRLLQWPKTLRPNLVPCNASSRIEYVPQGVEETAKRALMSLRTSTPTSEDLEQFEKETALLALAPPATSRGRREWQKVVDENKALLMHHLQLVQIAKEKLAYLMREVQEKCEQFQLYKRRRLYTSMTIRGQCTRWHNRLP